MAPSTRRSSARLADINARFDQAYTMNGTTSDGNQTGMSDENSQASAKNSQNSMEPPKTQTNGKHVGFAKPTPQRKARKDPYKDHDLLFGLKSKLNKVDLGKFLSKARAWDSLTTEQKAILNSMVSEDTTWGKSGSEQLPLGLLLFDMHWKSDVRVFSEDLRNGYYEPDWIQGAEEATETRELGVFDKWKLAEFEQHWGQKMEADRKGFGETGQARMLLNLFADGQLQTNDLVVYSRTFSKGRKKVVVEYEMKLKGMDDSGKLMLCLELSGEDGKVPENSSKRPPDDQPSPEDTQQGDDPALQQAKRQKLGNEAMNGQDIEFGEQGLVPMETDTLNNRSNVRRITPILLKPSTTTFSITTSKLYEVQEKLLEYEGSQQQAGLADPWKFFVIRRNGEDVGSLDDLRDKYWDKHSGVEQQPGLNIHGFYPKILSLDEAKSVDMDDKLVVSAQDMAEL